jgi:hypothetical protein
LVLIVKSNPSLQAGEAGTQHWALAPIYWAKAREECASIPQPKGWGYPQDQELIFSLSKQGLARDLRYNTY